MSTVPVDVQHYFDTLSYSRLDRADGLDTRGQEENNSSKPVAARVASRADETADFVASSILRAKLADAAKSIAAGVLVVGMMLGGFLYTVDVILAEGPIQ